ncbi:bactofilin family protein, partial [Klebsiella quasipneumoniae]
MDKQYLALNGALFFWLLALIAWSVDAIVPARLAAACALVAFLLHSQRNKINAMFIKKNKTEPQTSEVATPPANNPESQAVASKKQETTVIASGVHFVGNIVASGHVYIHGQLTGNIEAKEHLIKVMREGQVEGNISCRELIIDGKVQGQCRGDS